MFRDLYVLFSLLFAIGTDLGAAMVNLETGLTSWVCRGKSDVFAQQLDESVTLHHLRIFRCFKLLVHHIFS